VTGGLILLWGCWARFSGGPVLESSGLIILGAAAATEVLIALNRPNRLTRAEVTEILDARGEHLPNALRIKLGAKPKA